MANMFSNFFNLFVFYSHLLILCIDLFHFFLWWWILFCLWSRDRLCESVQQIWDCSDPEIWSCVCCYIYVYIIFHFYNYFYYSCGLKKRTDNATCKKKKKKIKKIYYKSIFGKIILKEKIKTSALLNYFYLLWTICPHLGSFLCCFFFHFVSPKFHLWPSSGDLPRPRIGMLSLVTVSPVITAFHSCCLSHHFFDQVNLWPAWVGFETAIFWQCSPGTLITGDTVIRLSIPIRGRSKSPEEVQRWNLAET